MEIIHFTQDNPVRKGDSVSLTLDVMHRAPINNEVNYDEFEMISARIEDGSLLVSDYDHLFTYTDNIIERTVFHIDSSVVKKCLGLEGSASDEDLLISIRDRFHGNYSGIVAWLVDNNIAFETSYYNAMEEWEERENNSSIGSDDNTHTTEDIAERNDLP